MCRAWDRKAKRNTGLPKSEAQHWVTEKRSATLARVRSPGTARDPLSVQTLSCPHSPRVQSHASASVGRLKIPDTGSHAVALDTQAAARTVVIGRSNALLAAAVTIPG